MLRQWKILIISLALIIVGSVFMLGVDEAFAAPNPPSSFSVSNVTSKGFKVSWSGGPGIGWAAVAHNLRYREKGITIGWTVYGPGDYTNLEFFSLKPATTYEYQVRTHAETIVPIMKWSGWSSTQEATTNRPPATNGSISNRTFKVEVDAITIDVSGYFTDPDSDTLTYTTSVANSGANVSVSLSDDTLTVTPGASAGTATVTVTASDVDRSATQSFTVTVEPYYPPETVGTIPDQTIKIGSTNDTTPARATIHVSSSFSHPDGDTMTYSATSSDTSIATVNVGFGIPISTLTITAVAAGSATITATATDSRDATATQTFTVTVQPNSAPVAVGSIPDQTVPLTGAARTVDVSTYFSDPDKNPLTYSATSSDTSIATVSVTDVTLTITAVAAGSATITVTATDNSSATATQTISVTVLPNRAPVKVGSISTQTVGVGGTAATVDVSSYFSDPDGNPLTYSATSSNTNRATVSVSEATLTITPVAAGWLTITVNATDPSNTAAAQTFYVNVVSNRSPTRVGTIPSQLVRVGSTAVTLDVSPYFSDPDGHTLTYSATSSSTSKATVSLSGSTLTITAVAAGNSTIRVKATDIHNASKTQSFSVKVVASDAVVRVGTIPAQTVALSETGVATVDVSPYFSGPDGETLTYSATSSSTSRATVSVSGSTVTITGVAAGWSTIRVTATNSSNATATQSFSTRVYANRAPTAVGTIPNIKIAQIWSEQFGVSSYFSDPDGNTLTYAASSSDDTIAEAGISPTDSSAVWVFGNGVGTATITVTATDPSNATATQTFSVEVAAEVHQVDAVPGLSSEEISQLGTLLTYRTVIINELHNGSVDANDWLELRNVSGAALPLDTWQLTVWTDEGSVTVGFPAGTVIPAGEVLLLTNTEMATADDMSVLSVVSEKFVLSQAPFALILRSPTVLGDLAGNYVRGEALATLPAFTVDTAWDRTQPIGFGYSAEAWAVSTYQNGLGTPGYLLPSNRNDLNSDIEVPGLTGLLSNTGFCLTLYNANGEVVDKAGNLDGDPGTRDTPIWKLPESKTVEGHRSSLIRRIEGRVPLSGINPSSWGLAKNFRLSLNTYWGHSTDIGNPGYRKGGYLPVTLSQFSAVRQNTEVVVRWTTESELDNAGFNIYRSETRTGTFIQINTTLIQGAGTTGERQQYEWKDTTAKPNVSYYYRIEDVSFSGVREQLQTVRMRGPVSAAGRHLRTWASLKSE